MMTQEELEYANIQDQLIEAKRDLNKLQGKFNNLERQFFEAAERYKSDLRAIHFLLSEVQSVGTHHEKEVVLRYIKLVLEKHINKSIGYYPQTDDLPF
jgi:hypothetical protein